MGKQRDPGKVLWSTNNLKVHFLQPKTAGKCTVLAQAVRTKSDYPKQQKNSAKLEGQGQNKLTACSLGCWDCVSTVFVCITTLAATHKVWPNKGVGCYASVIDIVGNNTPFILVECRSDRSHRQSGMSMLLVAPGSG